MIANNLDVVRLKDGRDATVLEVLNSGEAYRVETAAAAYEESKILELTPDKILKVIWKNK